MMLTIFLTVALAVAKLAWLPVIPWWVVALPALFVVAGWVFTAVTVTGLAALSLWAKSPSRFTVRRRSK